MSKQRGEALVFKSGTAVELLVGGASKTISARPVNTEQLLSLLAEALGAETVQRMNGAGGDFRYQSPFGSVALRVTRPEGAMAIRVQRADGDVAGLAALLSASAPVPPPPPLPTPPKAVARVGAIRHIDELFHQMIDLNASDLHLKAGKIPTVRVDGKMIPMPGRAALDGETINRIVHGIMPERSQQEFSQTNDGDFAHEVGGRARMRCNVFRDLAGVAAAFRQVPVKIPTVEELGLPSSVMKFCELHKGLVVVTGPTGSGKSTTLAAMVNWINAQRDGHLITIEDPIEFVHSDKRCHINQREIGAHTRSFKNALRAALREDPDIVMVGELRDLETAAMAIETAETGHLVFGTLHTNTASSAVDRLIDQYPADQQSQIRAMLSDALKGVVAQTLLPKKGGGRVAVLEVLTVIPPVVNLIREGKTFQIPSLMQMNRNAGMLTFSDSLFEAVKSGQIEAQVAYERAPDRKEFGALLTQGGFRGPWREDQKKAER